MVSLVVGEVLEVNGLVIGVDVVVGGWVGSE